jgi:hypothetical protein
MMRVNGMALKVMDSHTSKAPSGGVESLRVRYHAPEHADGRVANWHTVVLGEIANFAAYAFAPAILVTPLGALSVLIG